MRNGVHQQQTPLTIFIFKYIDTGIILSQLPEVDETYVQCIANECHITEGMGTNENGLLYEGLLEKNAGEKKSGSGQYFTPRVLIDVMTRLMKPQPGERCNDKIVAELIQAYRERNTSKPYEIRGFEVFWRCGGSGMGREIKDIGRDLWCRSSEGGANRERPFAGCAKFQ